MTVLSLFDGMSCGVLAMKESGVEIDRYVAYEKDKYAIQTSQHNFSFIEHRGDVFKADFTEFEGIDWLIGGSPCTYWSIAQKNNRETEASGMGWELFKQYVRALHEAKPKYFIYENNKSMSKDIRRSIDEAFGFEAVLINSALVSAQNRQRLYWVGRRNDDGTYSKVDVPQPQDRGILLKDILETGCDLSSCEKAYCLTASYNGACAWNTIERNQRTMIAEPVRIPDYGTDKARPINALYPNNCGGFEHRIWSDNPNKQQVDMIAEPINTTADCPCFAIPTEWDGKGRPIKARSCADGKIYTVYEVKDGKITIKGKEYPIKLPDGFYIIRKLTVRECMRLQTVPEWYEFPTSDSQAYKMLGNGWTVSVISYLINCTLR